MEDTIIISLFERIQYKRNKKIYVPGAIYIPDFDGSFLDFLFKGTEELHAKAGRYIDPEESPFYIENIEPIIQRRKHNLIDIEPKININEKIMRAYLKWIPSLCKRGDDNEYGSAALADIICLQSIVKRIEKGKKVAELKFREEREEYTHLIINNNDEGLMEKLTNKKKEREVLDRVKQKGERYNVDSFFIGDIYEKEIIPLTKEVELKYLKAKRSSLL
ncbi:chorismate mutase [Candidatus Woesearchaeota archaeon]|nr:chorismate mutase [Candidatus Woesearchaeota archaeon]